MIFYIFIKSPNPTLTAPKTRQVLWAFPEITRFKKLQLHRSFSTSLTHDNGEAEVNGLTVKIDFF